VFDLSIEKLLILTVVALFVLGPEKLPTAATWLAQTLRQIKKFTNDANQKIRSEIGPEFDEVRGPLNELRSELAGWQARRDPRAALLHHLHDDPFTPHGYPSPPSGGEPAPNPQPASPLSRPLAAGERPPIDPDTT
jgi:sec-independent protein translocase protein TatB